MAVARIGEATAREGQEEALREFMLEVIVPGVAGSPGCVECRAWQSEDEPGRFLIVEVWESAEAHAGAVRQIDPADIARFRDIVAEMGAGGYYAAVHPSS